MKNNKNIFSISKNVKIVCFVLIAMIIYVVIGFIFFPNNLYIKIKPTKFEKHYIKNPFPHVTPEVMH